MMRQPLTILTMIIVFGAFFLSSPPRVPKRNPTIGLIKHRGTYYRIEDLLNPAYRAASVDPFVKSFVPPNQVAGDPWAGLEVVNTFKRDPLSLHNQISVRRARELPLSEAQRNFLKQRGFTPWAGTHAPYGD